MNTKILKQKILQTALNGNWKTVKLGEVCEINPKNKIDDETTVSFIPMTLIQDSFANKHTSEKKKWKEVKKGFTHFQEGDIGIAKITPCFENRKSVIFKNLENSFGAGTTELHILRPNNKIVLTEFVFWIIKTEKFILNGIKNFTGAVGQQRVGKNIILDFEIPLPPLSVQQQIVSQIEILFVEIDRIEQSRQNLLQTVKLAKQKTLAELLNNDGWETVKLGEVCNLERGITFPSNAKQTVKFENSIACVRTANVQEKLELDDLWHINKSYIKNNQNKILKINDIIISSANSRELVGKTSYVDKLEQEMTFGGFVMVIRANKLVDNKYLFYFCRHLFLEGLFMGESTQTTNIANINSKQLNNFNISLPPLTTQKAIVERIEEIFAEIEKIEKAVEH